MHHVRNEERRQAEGRVEVRAQQSERSEETLHSEECDVGLRKMIEALPEIAETLTDTYHKMERPESATIPRKIGHKVDDHVIQENTGRGERNVGQGICNDDCGRTI